MNEVNDNLRELSMEAQLGEMRAVFQRLLAWLTGWGQNALALVPGGLYPKKEKTCFLSKEI